MSDKKLMKYNAKVTEYLGNTEVKYFKSPVKRLTLKQKEQRALDIARSKEIASTLVLSPEQLESKQQHSAHVSMARTKNMVYSIAQSNTWNWFVTFTFDPKRYPSNDYGKLVVYLSNWLKNIRKRYAPDLKYILVPELHDDLEKYHFHGLFADCGKLEFVEPHFYKGKMNYTLKQYGFGFSSCSLVEDNSRCASYITKYITKDLCCVTANKKRYWVSRNIDKPVVTELLTDNFETLMNSFDSVSYSNTIDMPFTGNNVSVFHINN